MCFSPKLKSQFSILKTNCCMFTKYDIGVCPSSIKKWNIMTNMPPEIRAYLSKSWKLSKPSIFWLLLLCLIWHEHPFMLKCHKQYPDISNFVWLYHTGMVFIMVGNNRSVNWHFSYAPNMIVYIAYSALYTKECYQISAHKTWKIVSHRRTDDTYHTLHIAQITSS